MLRILRMDLRKSFACVSTLIFFLSLFAGKAIGQSIAAWDFSTASTPATWATGSFNANLTTASQTLTRGSGASATSGTGSFRTQSFKNDGISTSNTDYFQATLTANTGYNLSLSTINATFNGTSTFYANPGVSSQFAYSLDGTTFTLIGSAVQSSSLTMATVSLTGVAALQNVPAGTTITLRYYASGQTTTGGWGFYSSAAGNYGLNIGGSVVAATSVDYYSAATGNLDAVATWGTNTDGTGTHPSNFTTGGQRFHVANSNPGTFSGSTWTVSGSSSKVMLDASTDLTIPTTTTISGTIDVGANRTLTIKNTTFPTWGTIDAASTIKFSGLTGLVPPVSFTYGNLTLDNTTVTTPASNTNLLIAGNFTLTNGATFVGANTTAGYSLVTSGAGNQTINTNGNTMSVWNFDAGNTNAKGSGTVTLASNSNITIDNTMIMNLSGVANQFSDGGNTITLINNLDLTGSSTSYNFTGTLNMNAAGSGSANIRGAGASTSPCVAAVNNLNLNNSIPIQVRPAGGSTFTVKGNLIVNGAATSTLVLNGNTLAVGGNFSYGPTTDNITSTGSTILFNGTTAQTYSTSVTAGNTIANVTVSNAAGLTLNSPMNVSGVLTLTNGVVSTGSNKLSITATGSVTGASASSYINGNLSKTMPSAGATSMAYEVGDATYAPVKLTFSSSVTSGSVAVKATAGAHPQIASSLITTSSYAGRYWTITSSGVAPSTVNVALSYNNGDMTGGENADYIIRKYSSSAWTTAPSITNTTSALAPLLADASTTTGVTGSSFSGDYVAGTAVCSGLTAGSAIPSPASLCVSGTSSLSLSGTSSVSGLSYQWQSSADGSSYSSISGATSATYTTPTISTTTFYRCGVGCIPTGSITYSVDSPVTVNPLPSPTLSGTGSIPPGGTAILTFSGTEGDVVYYWNGASTVSTTISATGTSTVTVSPSVTTTYSVTSATSAAGCTQSITGQTATITVSSGPTANISGTATICPASSTVLTFNGTAGATVYYTPDSGITTLSVILSGTSGTGTYTVNVTPSATTTYSLVYITSGAFSGVLSGSAVVTVSSLPAAYTVTGGGGYCVGGAGVSIGLSNTENDVDYQLYNGSSAVGSSVSGTGAAISFGLQTAAGVYTVMATNANSCSSNMTGSATVAINPLPMAYSVTGGGSYCSGSTGSAVGLSNSESNVNYQLYNGAAIVGSAVSGTGSAISFGLQTVATTYTVAAVNTLTGCASNMTGSATVTITPHPSAGVITGTASTVIGGGTSLADTASGGSWTSSNTSVATVNASGVVIGVAVGTTTISYSVTATCGTAVATLNVTVTSGIGSIAAWDFSTASTPATWATGSFNANLTTASQTLTRGVNASATSGTGSFRTQSFKNDGISTSNTDYFQATLTANAGYKVSLASINAAFNGTSTFYASPGVTSQFAYSLDGTTFTLIGSPVTSTSLTMTAINLSGVTALQNVPAGTTITLRYYASGQTTTGGWGFYSSAAGNYGLNIGGSVVAIPPVSDYYSAATGNLDAVATWGSNTDGTGTHPANFSTAGLTFHIANGNPGTFSSGTWSVSGATSEIALDAATDLTIPTTTTISGTIDVGAGRTLTVKNSTFPTWGTIDAASTIKFSGLSSLVLPVSFTYGNLTLDNTTVTTPSANTSLVIAGNFTLTNGATFTGANTTAGYNLVTAGTGNQTISTNGGAFSVWNFDAGNTNTKGSGTVTLASNSNITIDNTMIMNLSGVTNQFSDGGNTITLINNLDLTGASTSYNFTGTLNMNAAGSGSANIRGGGASTSPCVASVNNLNLNNSIPIQVRPSAGGSTFTVKGNLTVNGAATSTLVLNGNTLAVGGNFNYGPAIDNITSTSSTVLFNGTAAQTYTTSVTVGNTINNVIVNNASGLTLNAPLNVSGILTLTNGVVTTDSNTLSITSTGSVTGASASSYVNGNLSKTIATGSAVSKTYEVGDASYAPVTIAFPGTVSAAGNIVVKSNSGTHPQIASSYINTGNIVNHYWTISNSGVSATTANLSLSYGNSDIIGGSNTGFIIKEYAGSAWTTSPSETNTTSASAPLLANASITAGVPIASLSGDYVAGLPACTAASAGTATASVAAFCVPSSTTINLSGASSGLGITYQWQSSADGSSYSSITGATNSSYTTPVISSTTYYNCVVGCIPSSTSATSTAATVTINTVPVVSAIGGTASVCAGATVILSDSTTGGSWTSGNTSVATIGADGTVSAIASGTATITYSVTNGSGCTSQVTAVVTVNALPVVSAIGGNASVCAGATVVLSDSTTGGNWTSGNTSVATIGADGTVLTIASGTATITYDVTNGSGCTSQVTTVVTVNALPVVPAIGGTASVCAGATTTLTDTTTGGNWTSGNTSVATIGADGIVSGIASGNATITYNVINGSGCITQVTTVVTVNALPVVSSISGTAIVCAASTTILSDSTTGGSWISDNTSVATISAGGVVSGVAAGNAIITYSVTNGSGCTSQVTTVVTVNALPVIPAIARFAIVCAGSTTTLTDATTGGNWSSSNTSVATINDGGIVSSTEVGVVSGISAGTSIITYSVTNVSGCTNQVTKILTVNPIPVIPAIGGPATVCAGSFIVLADSLLGGHWDTSDPSIAEAGDDATVSGIDSVVTLGISAGTATIYYYVSDSFGCTSNVTKVLTVDALPVVSAINGMTSICAGSILILSDSTSGGTWSSSDPSIATISAGGVVLGIASGTSTITYSVTTGSGCTSQVTTVVTVNALPIISPINGTAIVCAGATTALTDAITGGSWISIDTSVATISAGGVVSAIASGTSIIIYSITTDSGCTSQVGTVVTVNALPVVSPISGTASVCAGSTIILSDATIGGSWISGNTSVATISAGGTVSAIAAGTSIITYTVTNGSGCMSQVTAVVTVNALPVVLPISGTASACAGSTTVLGDSTTGGSWISGNTSVATISAGGVVSAIASGTSTITYSVTNGSGCTSQVTRVVTVNALPVVLPISGTASVCAGSTIILGDSTTGGSWISGNTSVATISAGGVVSAIASGTSTITYSVTNGSGCTSQVTRVVTVNALPVVLPISGTASVCAGSTTVLGDSTTGGSWISGNTSVAAISAGGVVSAITSGTSTITYSVTNGSGCTSQVTAVVTVNALPVVLPISGTASVCAGSTTTLADSTNGGSWISGNTSVATISAGGVVLAITSGTSTITYSVTNGSGCTSQVTAVVTVNALPVVLPISGTASVCAGSTIILADSTTGGSWISGNTSVATISAGGIVSAITSGTSTITYSVTNGSGCTSQVTKVVTVNALPVVLPISGTASVCAGSTTVLNDSTTGGSWISGNTSVATISAGGVVSAITSGTSTITYSVTNGSGCTSQVTAVVTVNALPVVLPISGTASVCAGLTTILSDSTTGGSWISGNTSVATISAGGVVSAITSGTSTITYSVTNGSGCISQVTRVVTVNALPVVLPISGTASVCAGSTTTLADSTNGGSWISGNTSVATISAGGVVSAITSGTSTITYSVTNGSGCTSQVTAVVTVNALPVVLPISGTASVCAGSTTILADSTTGGSWISGNISVATISAGGVISAITSGTSTITYSVTNGSGCTSQVTSVVTVNALPVVLPISGTTSVCAGSTTILGDSTTSGSWISGNTSVATISAGGVVSAIASGTSTITYSVTTGSGCTSQVTAVVTVNALPVISPISGTASVCAGSATILTDSTTGGSWISGNTSVAVINASGFVAAITSGTSTITYSVTNGSGCTSQVTTVVTVNALPVVSPISGAASVCAGFTTTLADSTTGGGWISSNTSVATISDGGVVSAITPGISTIIYSVTTGSGCTSEVTTVINVNALPLPIAGINTLCAGGSATLGDSTTGGSWSSSTTSVVTVDSSTGIVTGVASGAGIITYTLGSGCYVTKAITVNALPSVITGPLTVCTGLSTSLSDATTGGSWTSSNVTIAVTGSATGIVTGLTPGTATITYTLGTGCITTTIVTVNAIAPITGTGTVCTGFTAALSDAITGGTWSSSAPFIATVNVSSGVYSGIAPGIDTISYTSASGCVAMTTVTVNATPFGITGSTIVCIGSTASLSDATTGGSWTSSTPAIATIDASGIVTGVASGTSRITYTLGTGCIATTVVTVNTMAPITGSGHVCIGFTSALSNVITGGSWTSSNTGIATVSASGVVTGISTGIATISYQSGSTCVATSVVSVNGAPSSISGFSAICAGSTQTLNDAISGGVWSSSNTAIATIDAATGIVTGVAGGTSVITYSTGSGCSVTGIMTINPLAPITGSSAVCIGLTTSLTDATAGGTWSSGNTSIATIGSASGIVTGVANGSAAITYTLGTGCQRVINMSVNPAPSNISGVAVVCAGSTTTLTDATAGGLWSSGNLSVATIGSTTGIVTGIVGGVAGGVVNITYTAGTGCRSVAMVTVNALPANISGTPNVCIGSSATITDATINGTWSSSNAEISIVGSTSGIVTGVATGSATISYTLPSGCSKTITVTVNPLPSAISGTSEICSGTTSTLSHATSGGTWASSNTAVATVVSGTGVMTGVAAGTATITYKLPGGCFITNNVTIDPLPSAITGIFKACPGTTTTLSDSTASGIWSSGNTAVATIDVNGIVSGVASGNSVITYTSAQGCVRTASLTINPLPAAITGTMAICAGASTTLNDATSVGAWTSSNTAVATIVSPTHVVSAIAAGTTTITYTLSTGCTATTTFTVNQLPSAITGLGSECVGAVINLSDSTFGGTWTTGNTSVATVNAGTGDVTGVASGTTRITYTLPTGCITSGVVTVNSLPASIGGTTVACAGTTAGLTDVTTGGTWSSSNTAIAAVGSTGVISGVAAGTATISYIFSTGCGTTRVVTINPLPSAITGTGNACIGATMTLSDASAGGTWSSSSSNVSVMSGTGVITGVTAGTAVVTYTLPTGCITTATVTVNAFPAIIAGTANVCPGLTTTLTDATGGGAWSTTDVTATIDPVTGIVTGVNTGTATITYTSGAGCIRTAVVTVNVVPTAILGTTVVCAGSTTTLSDAVTPGMSWTSSNTSVATISSGSGVVTGVAAGTTTITYKASSGCLTTTMVSVNPLPTAVTGIMSVCAGSVTSLSDAASGGTWSSSAVAGTIDAASGAFTGVAAGTAVVTYTLPTGCAGTAIVTVNPLPTSISGTGYTCVGSTTMLIDAGGGTWASGNTAVATVNISNGIVTGLAQGTSLITYTLATGCTANSVVTINALPSASTGITSMCVGSSTTLSNTLPGGTWVSAHPTIATIDAASGVVTGVAAGTTFITYTFGTGCNSTIVVTVNAIPSAITGPQVLCVGNTIAVGNTVGGGTWSSSNTSIAAIGSASGIISGITAGTSIITYALPSGCAATATVTVNTIPAITGAGGVCIGNSISLANAAVGGTWSSSNASVATVGSGTGVVTSVSAGVSNITYSLFAGCATTTMVTVNALPNVITGTAATCQGSTTTLAEITTGGTWSSDNGTIASVNSIGVVTGVAAGTTTISYTVGSGCSVTRVVTINALPSAITGAPAICIGTTVTLIDAVSGGTWSSSSSTVSVYAASGAVAGISSGSAIITYTLPTGCATTTVFSVNALPGLVSGTMTVCPGLTTTLTDATTGGTWVTTDAAASVDPTSGIVTGISSGTAIVTYTSAAGCSRTATVTVNTAPTAILGTTSVCIGSTVTLSDAVTPGIGWTSSTTAVATVGASTGAVTGITTGTSTVTYKAASGCITTAVVTVNPLPSTITGTMKACLGATTTLADADGGGAWTSSNTTAATVDATGTISGLATGTTVISYTLPTGCIRTTIVTVSAAPGAITGNAIACIGTTTTLADPNLGGTWSSGSTSTATINVSNGIVTGVAVGTTTMTYILSGCPATTVLTVNPIPSVSTGTTVLCAGSTVTLSNALPGGTWSSQNAAIATVGSSTGIVTGVTGGAVAISYSFGGTCRSGTVVTINAIPVAITGTATVCTGATTTLADATSGGTWSSAATSIATIGTTRVVTGISAGTATISYTLPTGCARTATVTVNPVPNAGAISGPSSIHIAVTPTITLTDGVSGGAWSSSNTAVATVDASGNVTGVAAGMATISYAVSNSCGTAYATQLESIAASRYGTASVSTEANTASVIVYPNPNKGAFVIKAVLTSVNDEEVTIEITDMLGQIIYKNKVIAQGGKMNEHVQLSNNLANGMYLLNVKSGAETYTTHFMLGQ